MTAINVYSKEQVDSKLEDKQGTLTAGANITISADNVISSTGGGGGGSYVAGEGISISGQTISNAAIPDVNKAYVDAQLATKPDTADVYTKTQADTLLALKADKATTYTKTEVDTALALKADKATTYTKTEVDALVPSVTSGSVTLTVAGWASDTQSVTISGISGKNVIIGPAPASTDDYIAGGIRITAQSGDVLTFTANTTPTNAITVDYVVIG